MSAVIVDNQGARSPDRHVSSVRIDYPAVFPPERTVAETIDALRELARSQFVVYAYVLGPGRTLDGVVAMRDLLFARPDQTLRELMIPKPFALREDLPLLDAMRLVVDRHFPIYPVVAPDGTFAGVVHGAELFKAQAVEITAQAGSMVGVDAGEGVSTPVGRSLRFRHPWLQFNLLTCFVSAGVVGIFEGVINQYVILAIFLPVMVGQSTNIGCQALAVALRGMTLGEVKDGGLRLLIKEARLGLINGALSGITAGLGLGVYAAFKGDAQALQLGLIMLAAMTGASLAAGFSGAAVPLVLRRFGADPATASSIFLTTIAEVAAIGSFLGLALLFLA